MTPLQIFYGSANYDIDDINVDDLTLDNFDAIASVRPLSACLPPPHPSRVPRIGVAARVPTAVCAPWSTQLLAANKTAQANANYPPGDVAKVASFVGKLSSWAYGAWREPVTCGPSNLQNVTKVKLLFARLMTFDAMKTLSSTSGGMFFDKYFSVE